MAGWCSASPAVQAMPLVGAALSADREQARSYRFWGLGLDCVGWQKPCGSWLASDGIAAVWLPDRSYRFWGWGLDGVGWQNPCGSWLASDGIAAVWLSDRSYRFWGWVWMVSAGRTLVGAGLPAMASLRSGCRTAVTGFGFFWGGWQASTLVRRCSRPVDRRSG